MRITLNEDVSFLISDEYGDIPKGAELGLYSMDARFLSCYSLTLDGQRPLLLSAHATSSSKAMHFLTNPPLAGAPRGTLSLVREQTVANGMREEICVTNFGDAPAQCTLELRLESDFAHVFEVKHAVEVTQEALQRRGTYLRESSPDGRTLRLHYARGSNVRQLVVTFSQVPEALVEQTCRFVLRLAPRQEWRLDVRFAALADAETTEQAAGEHTEEDAAARHASIVSSAPTLETDSYILLRAYDQSVNDFAALRLRGELLAEGDYALAAGIPWFMTLFGRDSLIAAYQALPFYPEAAKGVLRALARLQGTTVDVVRAEEPGKILHEHREGLLMRSQRIVALFPYYGTVDATPLFLMLLAAVYRATRDVALLRQLRPNALRALEWMERYGDRDGDGYLEYQREGEHGLENQGWKDSGDAVRFQDGRLAVPPIALCEVQGYAYAARIGLAEVFDALRERRVASRLRRDAAALKARFNRDFWLPERGCYALALDGSKRPVDALTSNPGHLLWTGIADEEKARLVAQRLLSAELFSGWGVRTMGSGEGGYNPISYHNGSVWPHDNSLIIAGLARYGFTEAAAKITGGLISALSFQTDYRLPELFAGFGTNESPFPVEYPTANRPQAWASCSVFLLLASMAGLDVGEHTLRGHPFLPDGIQRIALDGLWMDGHRTAVTVKRGKRGVYSYVPERPRTWWFVHPPRAPLLRLRA